MWQRFTERARRVIYFAQEEAGRLGETYVSTEHLLLGIVRENDSVAARILDRMGVSLGRIRSEIERQVAKEGDGKYGQDIQLTPRAKRVIDLAYDESRQLNSNYIGTEHLLLGLIREGEGLAGRVLSKLGVDLERTRREVMHLQQEVVAVPGGTPPTKGPDETAEAPGRGDLGVLRSEDEGRPIELARDEIAFLEMVAVFLARDHHGYREMLSGERIVLLPEGTEIKRLEPFPAPDHPSIELLRLASQHGCLVRVLSGDHAGRSGWVFWPRFHRTGADNTPFPPDAEAR